MRTYGPRFDSRGYQFPRVRSAASYHPCGPPIKTLMTATGGIAQIIPLAGGRDRLFNVHGQWTDADGTECSSSDIVRDEIEAFDAWKRLLGKMR